MRERERSPWERLFDSEFCIRASVGFCEGDKVRVTSGALVGLESLIKKINRHKREAIVEMEMMGDVRRVKLMLEVVEKIGGNPYSL
jgi:transcriptional antiterminator NusG